MTAFGANLVAPIPRGERRQSAQSGLLVGGVPSFVLHGGDFGSPDEIRTLGLRIRRQVGAASDMR
jgi:hypothetical protein